MINSSSKKLPFHPTTNLKIHQKFVETNFVEQVQSQKSILMIPSTNIFHGQCQCEWTLPRLPFLWYFYYCKLHNYNILSNLNMTDILYLCMKLFRFNFYFIMIEVIKMCSQIEVFTTKLICVFTIFVCNY